MRTAVIITIMLIAAPAMAQRPVQCGEYDKLARTLVHKYGEAPFWQGVGPKGKSTYELWVSADRTSWTVLQVKTDGKACMRASGDAWFALPWPPASGV